MLTSELRSKIDKLWNMFWANGMPEHVEALEHMSYLIFMRKLEEYENDRVQASKKSGEKYTSVFDGKDEMKWSIWKNYDGKKMLNHVKTKVFPFIKSLENKKNILQLQLGDANFEMKSSVLLQDAIGILDDLKISQQNQDVQGDIFEYMMSKLKTAGLNGQFRTPRHIIRMMIELLDPDVNQTICDPACGTGGFLVNAYQHILKKYTSKELLKFDKQGVAYNLVGDLLGDKRDFLMKEQLFGFDFSNTMIRICIMNIMLHGLTSPNIHYFNSLGKEFNQNEEYQLIFANPPFAGKLNKSEINDGFKISSTKTELLFLELMYSKLVKGGQAAIIVPSGVLFGSSKAHLQIRKTLLEKCQLEAIIYLPGGVFKPYSGVSTAILFFTKGGNTDNVWLYDLRHDGFSLDDKRLPVEKNDIPDVLKKFPKREQSHQSLTISIDEIKENDYNLNLRKYIDKSKPEKEIDIQEIIEKLKELEKIHDKSNNQMTSDLREMGFKV